MKPLLVAVVLLLAAPAGASAALEVHFNVDQAPNGVENGQILAKDGAQYIIGGPIGLALERGGQIVAASSGEIGFTITGIVPQPGDRLHVLVNGVERAIVAYDGRPVVDGNCSPDGATVAGSFMPGSSLEVARWPDLAERAVVATDADHFTATFPRVLRGAAIGITSHATQPALDGSPVDVYVRRSTTASCALGTTPLQHPWTEPEDCTIAAMEERYAADRPGVPDVFGEEGQFYGLMRLAAKNLGPGGITELLAGRGKFKNVLTCPTGTLLGRIHKLRRGKPPLLLAAGRLVLDFRGPGRVSVRLRLTKRGRSLLRGSSRLRVRATVRHVDLQGTTAQLRVKVTLSRGAAQ